MRLDLTLRMVQTGNSISGFSTYTIREEGTCTGLRGYTGSATLTGTVTGSLASGSGTFTGTSTDDGGTGITATFTNGRMTGTLNSPDGPGTFVVNRQ